MKEWMKTVQLFKKYYLMLMHLTDRLLMHETELMIIQFKNSINRESCRVFVKNKMMIMIIIYHKRIRINRKIKIIHCYLLCEIRELLLYHMWLIMLFWRKLKAAFTDERAVKKKSAFLWKSVKKKQWKRSQSVKKR